MYELSSYDVAPFAGDEGTTGFGFGQFFNKAPYFARNKEYIEKNVTEPTDYVVIDHGELEMALMKSGMDSVSYWNVWRLTPGVYRDRKSKNWVVKRDLAKLDADGIKERSEYVLDTTINLFVSADQRLAATRSPETRRYYIDLRRDGVPVYRKADKTSEVVTTTPPGLRRVDVDFHVPPLNGDGMFWHVSHFDKLLHIWGYIDNDEVGV